MKRVFIVGLMIQLGLALGFVRIDGQVLNYDFENQPENWAPSENSRWKITTEKSASSSHSLKYALSGEESFRVSAITSIDTHHTILKVRIANNNEGQLIIGSDYDGVLVAVDYSGAVLWERNTGEGTMNHDLWCADLTGDGVDEILAANANGRIYCFDVTGKVLWVFQPFESFHLTPMYAVCVVRDKELTPYVVCGDFTSNIYYLSSTGELVKTVPSTLYSKVKGWGSNAPEKFKSVSNFLRPIPQPDGSDLLLIHSSNNHMQSDGEFHVMKPLAETSHCYIADPQTKNPVGDVRLMDGDGDGKYELVYGTSTLNTNIFCRVVFNDDYSSGEVFKYVISSKDAGVVSYRVNQPVILPNGRNYDYGILSSTQLLVYPGSGEDVLKEKIAGTYTYNDVWSDKQGRLILASSQDGGSCVYIINTHDTNWKDEFKDLEPSGKIAEIKSNAQKVRDELTRFVKPLWQRPPVKVVGFEGQSLPIASGLEGSESLELFASPWNHGKNQEPSWRSPLYDGNSFKDKRDKRNDYVLTEEEVFDLFAPSYADAPGIQTWAGHGNDPLYYNLDVLKRIADYGYENGKKRTIYVYPEMNHYGEEFDFVMNHQIYPLVQHLESIGGKVAFRAKNIFWQGQVYTDTWADVLSGKYADAVIPILEETTDKTQDLSIVGRLGLWVAGAVDGWGVRCSRDDPSFDRSRQFSSQKLSNHILRKTIFSLACGASYIHNAYPDNENPKLDLHTSLALELIEKEALYVPKRNEILSFSPVHLSITSPRESYLNEGENNKWITYYDRQKEESQPAVFSHLNGSWLGAALTPWDFSSYASGVVDRRQNCIPPCPNGLVLITPVQNGALADNEAPRGKMIDHLHPIYRNIMKEYVTDGVDYVSSDGNQHFKADEYYSQIKRAIEEGAKKLPITVSSIQGGQVGWVVAQMNPTHLRLTLVDGGYLNPNDKKVKLSFNTITPVKIQDVLDNTLFKVSGASTEVDVPCGMFRFIDIELSSPLK